MKNNIKNLRISIGFKRVFIGALITGLGFLSAGCEMEIMQSSANSSSHYSGTDCLASGCHASGENTLTIAGTLYSNSSGSSTVTGGIVTVSNGNDTIDIESDLNGNFYTNDSRFSSGTLTSASTSNGSMVSTTSLPSGCTSCHGSSTSNVY